MPEIILEVKNLNVNMAGEIIFEKLDFEVRKGETIVVLGPNGAGKTVLLKALLNLIPYGGRISWKKGTKIGYVPQRVPFVKDMPLSVRDFFWLKNISDKEARRLLGEVGISEKEFLAKSLGKLSSGQFQRVLIAWGLGNNPEVLLFDEPTSGIDIKGEETIYNLLEKLKRERGLTIIMVSHDLTVVYKFASNVLCLNRKLLCFGPPREELTPENISQLYVSDMKLHHHNHNE